MTDEGEVRVLARDGVWKADSGESEDTHEARPLCASATERICCGALVWASSCGCHSTGTPAMPRAAVSGFRLIEALRSEGMG